MKYNRILLKLSGEALLGNNSYGIDNDRLVEYAEEINQIHKEGVEIADWWKKNPKIEEHTELLFKWFENHLHKLHKIFVMGGEPFLQKETFRFIDLSVSAQH